MADDPISFKESQRQHFDNLALDRLQHRSFARFGSVIVCWCQPKEGSVET
jgi:hypothetical protein